MNDEDGSAVETDEGTEVENSDGPDETTGADTGDGEPANDTTEVESEHVTGEAEQAKPGEDENHSEAPEGESERRIEELETELDERIAELERRDERIEELEAKLKRVQADFQNYKKRREREEQRLRETATEDLVTRLLDVRDNLVRATEQDEDAEIREGVEATLREFDYVLGGEDVSTIEPEPGTEIDPQRHEVMVRVESDRPEGTIDELYTSGYEMGEKVLRPAQVTVSEGTEDE
ncbi:MAG: nucleotide exchange factor GrpE [Euryarchaeota archaeon]|nr:nucleotide exchange factor GrpE [Euryarchaeota archaeon]